MSRIDSASSILVVEPHADDALLSLGGSLELWRKEGKRTGVLTVYSSTRRRGLEAFRYARAIGAEHFEGGYTEDEGGLEERDVEIPELDLEEISELGWDEAIWPLSICHPEHRAVAINAPAGSLLYVDQPYETIQKNGPELRRRIVGRRVEWWLRPHKRKWRHIPIFKDQARFFYFNNAEKLSRSVEVVVS
jgi:hypothetical protein